MGTVSEDNFFVLILRYLGNGLIFCSAGKTDRRKFAYLLDYMLLCVRFA